MPVDKMLEKQQQYKNVKLFIISANIIIVKLSDHKKSGSIY